MLNLPQILVSLALLSNLFLYIDIKRGKVPFPPPTPQPSSSATLSANSDINPTASPEPTVEITPTVEVTPIQPTSLPTIIPTHIPTPVPTAIPIASPIPTAQPTSDPSGAHNIIILGQINQYRAENNLKAFETHPLTCDFAQTRAGEVPTEFSHAGFDQRVEDKKLPYSTFTLVTENIAYAGSYTQIFDLWKNSPGHRENLLSDTKYACVRNSGKYYVFESWSP